MANLQSENLEKILDDIAKRIEESTKVQETDIWRTIAKFLLGVIVALLVGYGSILYTISHKIKTEAPYLSDKPLIESTLLNLSKSSAELKEMVETLKYNQIRLHPEEFKLNEGE
jgi:hypothetical protein